MKMKGCELCGRPARMYCESDEASLCWDCDEKVHGANFLVARHSRSLLCHVCQSPTPWKASGPKLTPTVSVCEGCADNHDRKCERGGEAESEGANDEEDVDDDDDNDGYSYSYGGDDEEEGDEEEDEEEQDVEVENQVVPLTCASSSSSPQPPAASSSSSSSREEELSSTGFSTLKRARENADLDSDDEIGCSSSLRAAPGAVADEEATSVDSFRPLKQRRITEKAEQKGQEEARSTTIINSLRRLEDNILSNGGDSAATVLGICKLSRDQSG